MPQESRWTDALRDLPRVLHKNTTSRTSPILVPTIEYYSAIGHKIFALGISYSALERPEKSALNAMRDLPADVLFLICEELAIRQDFGTLFNCAVSSKSLVTPALLWVYRYDLEHLE